ncbi:Ig-like domain-containing protein [Thomasclavelia saccharogumia]|uniref:Ig-like domain-containing protein n=1 Tax=Thomasclavelia saccharogumia TaxID=341225 RepID=UPI00047D7288|nr:Ig-like domain-containing protein [Thomasclavelia saccharogumia]
MELKISASSLNLEANQSNKINIKTNSNVPVQYFSSNESVASVDNDGNIKALKAGNTTITARINERSVICDVTVKDKQESKAAAVSQGYRPCSRCNP